MGLKKRKSQGNIEQVEKRKDDRSFESLIATLKNSDSNDERRWAARDLKDFPEAVNPLIDIVLQESDHVIREVIFSTLQIIGNQDVVKGLIPVLSEEDAELRNSAIEVLQAIPDEISEHIIALLNNRDSDVRIFAIDILQVLAHQRTPEWLLSVLKDETHVNVVATALDRLAEVGTPDMADAIIEVGERFKDEQYIQFACKTALRRIESDVE
jgi:HEAT repeat protein